MTQDELLKTYDDMKDSLDSAPESPVPFPVVKDEKISVIGDANETQINKHDFKIVFEFPKGTISDETVVKETEYKDVFITPRRRMEVVTVVCRLMPFFRSLDKDNDYTPERIVEILGDYGDYFANELYDLVASVLQIDEKLVDFMKPSSVLEAATKIFSDYPEVLNEAESFF